MIGCGEGSSQYISKDIDQNVFGKWVTEPHKIPDSNIYRQMSMTIGQGQITFKAFCHKNAESIELDAFSYAHMKIKTIELIKSIDKKKQIDNEFCLLFFPAKSYEYRLIGDREMNFNQQRFYKI